MAEHRRPSSGLELAVAVLDFPGVVIAKLAAWLILPMVAALVYEVVARYLFGSPTMWAYDTTYMLAGTLFMLGSAYALRNGSHVRADFLLSTLSPRWQALVDVLLYIIVYFPAMGLFFWASYKYAFQSWAQHETYPQSPWMPIIYPLKSIMPLSIGILFIQGISELLKGIWTVRHNAPFQQSE